MIADLLDLLDYLTIWLDTEGMAPIVRQLGALVFQISKCLLHVFI